MLHAIYERSFERDVKKAQKRGKDLNKIKFVIELLLQGKTLPTKYRNHKLKGNYKDYWECHIEPDWLLIYKKSATTITLAYTGTHADLF